MEHLRRRLASLCGDIAPPAHLKPPFGERSRLVALTPKVLLVLTASNEIACIDIRPHKPESLCLLKLSCPLPTGCHSLLLSESRDFLLVHGDRVIRLIHLHNVLSMSLRRGLVHSITGQTLKVDSIGVSLFEDFPSLRLLHVDFHPHSRGSIVILTSDSYISIFDAYISDQEVESQRIRIRTRGSAPVSFAFGQPYEWDFFSIYILAEDGLVYVLCPVAPFGTRIPKQIWKILHRHSLEEASRKGEEASTVESVMQPELRLLFLESFVGNKGEEMVKMKDDGISCEVLCQGPVDIDDNTEDGGRNNTTSTSFVSISTSWNKARLAVLVNSDDLGNINVLVAIERNMPVWYEDKTADYAREADAAAPKVLLFERMELPHKTWAYLLPISQDAFFVSNGPSVLSMHMPWLPILSDPDVTHHALPTSSLRMIFTMKMDYGGRIEPIVGLAGVLVSGMPLAVALTKSFKLKASQQLSFPLTSLPSLPKTMKTITQEYEDGNEDDEATAPLPVLPETQVSTFPVEGLAVTLSGEKESVAGLLKYLTNRLDTFTQKTLPCLISVSNNVETNIECLHSNLASQNGLLKNLEDMSKSLEISALPVRTKLRRVLALDANLRERVEILRRIVVAMTPLSAEERKRSKWLQERLRKAESMKKTLQQLREAVHQLTQTREDRRNVQESPRRELSSGKQRHGLFPSPFRSPATRKNDQLKLPGRASISPVQRNSQSPRFRRSIPSEPDDISQHELDEITKALSMHAKEINTVTKLAASLWKDIAVS